MSLYFYEDRFLPRTTRLTLMYCRILSLAAFSSIFNQAASSVNFFPLSLLLTDFRPIERIFGYSCCDAATIFHSPAREPRP